MQHKKIAQAVIGILACLLPGACSPVLTPPPTALPATATPAPTVIPAPDTPAVSATELDPNDWLSRQDPVFWLGWSADGRSLVARASSSAYLLDLQTSSSTPLAGSATLNYPAALDPQGKRVVTGDQVWEFTDGRQLYQLPLQDISSSVFSPDGATLAIGGSNDITLWDAASGKLQKSLGSGLGDIRALAFSADGKVLYAVSDDHQVQRYDLPGGTVTQPFTLPQGGCCAAFNADARYILVNLSNHGAGTKELWDVQKGARLIDMGHCDSDSILQAFSQDSRFFVIGPCFDEQTSGYVAQVWDLQAGHMLHTFTDPQIPNFVADWRSAAFSPDGTKLALGDPVGRVLLWDLSSDELLQTISLK